MATAPQPKPSPVPAVLVYGWPNTTDLPQASWFRAEDRAAAKAAAAELKFSVLELQTDAEKALMAGVGEGVLKGSGRMVVGSVSRDVYRRIEEHRRGEPGVTVPSKSESAKPETATKPVSEQTTNTSAPAAVPSEPVRAAPPASAAPTTAKPDSVTARETLRVGARVLAAYWNEKREFEGFWLATLKRIEPDGYTLEWFDAPEYPAFKSRPQDVAMLHPEFRVSGK
jgi:hypothetical protein